MILLGLSALLLAALWAYNPSLDGPFLLDDAANIRPLTVNSLAWEELHRKVLSGRFGGYSRSVGKLSFALTQYASGYRPRPFKYQNLMLHLANGLLVFWLAALLFRISAGRARADAAARWPALLVCAVWLLHPLQLSAVAYAVQRLVLLSTFFTLLTAICYLKGRLLLSTRPRAGASLMLFGFLLFWPLGLLSKENAILLSPALLLVELFVLRFQAPPGLPRRLLWFIITVFLILPIVVALAFLGAAHESLLAGYVGRDFTLADRVLTQAHVLWFYLQLILMPIPGLMGLYHDDFPVQRVLDATTLLRVVGIVMLIGGAFALRRRAPLVGLGILWFFVWHAMESSIVPLELVFEHRNYLALFGPALVLAAAVTAAWRHEPLRRAAVAGATALVLLLGLNTASRAVTWSDHDTLAANEYLHRPESPRAVQAMLMQALALGDREAAARLLLKLQQLVPDEAWPLFSELLLRCNTGTPPAGVVTQALQVIRTGFSRPADVDRLRGLTELVYADKCPNLTRAQITALAAALAENPRVHDDKTRLGALGLYARIAAKNGDFEAAEETLREAIALAQHGSPVWLEVTVQAAADAASQLGSYDAAVAFVAQVTASFEETLMAKDVTVHLSLKPPRKAQAANAEGDDSSWTDAPEKRGR